MTMREKQILARATILESKNKIGDSHAFSRDSLEKKMLTAFSRKKRKKLFLFLYFSQIPFEFALTYTKAAINIKSCKILKGALSRGFCCFCDQNGKNYY